MQPLQYMITLVAHANLCSNSMPCPVLSPVDNLTMLVQIPSPPITLSECSNPCNMLWPSNCIVTLILHCNPCSVLSPLQHVVILAVTACCNPWPLADPCSNYGNPWGCQNPICSGNPHSNTLCTAMQLIIATHCYLCGLTCTCVLLPCWCAVHCFEQPGLHHLITQYTSTLHSPPSSDRTPLGHSDCSDCLIRVRAVWAKSELSE
jgi:hypothetical protein